MNGSCYRKKIPRTKKQARQTPLHTTFKYSFIYFIAIESAALVERLLNDLIRVTEGFQKLKKQNDELRAGVFNEKQSVLLPYKLIAHSPKEGK